MIRKSEQLDLRSSTIDEAHPRSSIPARITREKRGRTRTRSKKEGKNKAPACQKLDRRVPVAHEAFVK
jgi:hypothetical protein